MNSTNDGVQERPWFTQPLRLIQTILRTCDAPGYRAQEFIDFALRNHANAVVINGGGLQAFYPSDVPGHEVVADLEQDILGAVTAAAADAGLKVLARVDFRAGPPAMAQQHPQWFAADIHGEPLLARGRYTAPATSPYRADGFAFDVVDELLTRYPIDGIWENAPGFLHIHGGRAYPGPLGDVLELGEQAAEWRLVDYSQPTADAFRHDTGLELPTPADFDAQTYLTFIEWRYAQVAARCSAMREVIKAHGTDLAYIAEAPGVAELGWNRNSALDVAQLAPLFDIMAAPTFDVTRDGYGSAFRPNPVWRCTEVASHLRAAKPDTAPTIMFGRFDNVSRYTTVAPAELDLWLLGGLAQGAGNWECTFVGRSDTEFHDRRADHIIENHYRRVRSLDEHLDGARSIAQVAVVHSRKTETVFGATDPALDRSVHHVRGAAAALLAQHVPFDLIPDDQLLDLPGRYSVVVLPNTVVLSDEQVRALTEFVANGGGVVATGTTSSRVDATTVRERLGLAQVFGIEDRGRSTARLDNAFALVTSRDELTVGLDGTDMITTQGTFRVVDPAPSSSAPITLIEEIAPQPPEWGWVDLDVTGRPPFVVRHEFGAGRSVYFPGEIDKHVASSGHSDHSQLLVNAVRWAAGVGLDVGLLGPDGVHVHALASGDGRSLLLSLVNYSAGPGRPVKQVIGVQDLVLTVTGATLAEVSGQGARGQVSLRVTNALDGTPLRTEMDGDVLRVHVPRIQEYLPVLIGPA